MNETIHRRHCQNYSNEEKQRVIRLRQAYHPKEIAKAMNRTEGAIYTLLYKLKQEGYVFPKLPHKNLKYGNEVVNTWRSYRKPIDGKRLTYKQIAEITGYPELSNAAMSRQMSMQLHGELIG
jgi:transposase